MARRTISFIVAIHVDEDTMRQREDDDREAWDGVIGTLTTALETIAYDNLDGLDARVAVAAGNTGIEYHYAPTPPAVPGDGYCQDEPERDA